MRVLRHIFYAILGAFIISSVTVTVEEIISYKKIYNRYDCPTWTRWEYNFWSGIFKGRRNSYPNETIPQGYDPYEDLQNRGKEQLIDYIDRDMTPREVSDVLLKIEQDQKNCEILVESPRHVRVLLGITIKALQPLHLILGWFLMLCLAILKDKLSSPIQTTLYVTRGASRITIKLVKNIFDKSYKFIRKIVKKLEEKGK